METRKSISVLLMIFGNDYSIHFMSHPNRYELLPEEFKNRIEIVDLVLIKYDRHHRTNEWFWIRMKDMSTFYGVLVHRRKGYVRYVLGFRV